jgi:AhpD family alkylhydroperoxidase
MPEPARISMAREIQSPDATDELKQLLKLLGEHVPGLVEMLNVQDIVFANGVLSSKIKHLIAVSMAVADRCDGTIGYHVEKALLAGASRQEVLEVVTVAVYMHGPSSIFAGAKALAFVTQFEAVN